MAIQVFYVELTGGQRLTMLDMHGRGLANARDSAIARFGPGRVVRVVPDQEEPS